MFVSCRVTVVLFVFLQSPVVKMHSLAVSLVFSLALHGESLKAVSC